MAAIKPMINVEYTGKATVVRFTDEKILEEKDIQALQDSIMPMIESRVRRDQSHPGLRQRPISFFRGFGAFNPYQQKDLRERRPPEAL